MNRFNAIAITFALSWSVSAAANETGREPYALARALQFAQDATVRDGGSARAAVVAAVERMAAEFPNADAAAWKDARNARALSLFLLSGGPPRVVRTIVARAELPKDETSLIRGALAFAEGRHAEATRLLEPLDPLVLPADVGGHVALVQAALIPRDKPDEQLARLSVARLLMPGSIIEESALRRSVDIAASARKDEQTLILLEQYHRRFPRSAYAPTLEARALGILTEQLLSEDGALRERAISVSGNLRPEQRKAILVQVAQRALRTGSYEPAMLSAGRLLAEATPGTQDAAKASLYLGAAEIVAGRFDEGVGRLTRVEQGLLDAQHQRLHRAATLLAMQMRSWPPNNGKAPPKRPNGETTVVDKTISHAETLLVDATRAIKKAGPK
ncbi:MAG: hypothetical protein ACK4MV_10885 [Beijerinckiaceae bacterium]